MAHEHGAVGLPLRPWIYAFWYLLCLAAPAHAVPVTVLFEGTVSGVNDPLGLSWNGNLQIGDAFQFVITFDDESAGTPNPGGGVNYSMAGDVIVLIGTFGYAGPGVSIELIDDFQGTLDFVNVSGGILAGAAAGATAFMNGPATWLASEDLADVSWTNLVGGNRSFGLTIYHFGPGMQLRETSAGGPISSITLVPEPGGTLLIGTGLTAVLGLAPLRRRRPPALRRSARART